MNLSIRNGRKPVLEIGLDLSRHCIETACRRRYNRAISLYFKNPPDTERLEQEIGLLRSALETVDFGRLRRDHDELAGGHSGPVFLSTDSDGRMFIRFGESILHTVP